jgi:UDP-2-acetamido-3-amino-2,3-dideoxy-glucuronate N-acetyltransferase
MSEYGQKLIFDSSGFAICPESGERYKIEDGRVSKII